MTNPSAQVTKIQLETLDLAKKYVRHGLKLNSDQAKPDYEADTPLYELWRSAADPLTSPAELKELLNSEDNDAIRMALFNPSLPISEAASLLRLGFESHIEKRSKIFAELNQEGFEEKFDFKNWDMDSDDLDDFEAAIEIKLEESADPFERHYMFEEEADEFILDVYVVIKHGSENQRKFIEKKHAGLFEFIESLERTHLIGPYLFWTLYSLDFNFNREYMQTEFDGHALAEEESFDDPGAVAFLHYPEDFKPIEDINEEWIYNIESGMFGVGNQILPAETASKNSNSSKYEVLAGEGDGYYPTIPFFDAFGELQAVTTFFIDMSDAEYLDFCLEEDASFRSKVFESRIPAKLGYLKSTGSLFFGDSYGLSSDADSSYKIVEFENVPVDDYLVVAYIDSNKRPWAVSVLRDRAKRNYEILFEVFPELTKVLAG